VWYMPCPHCPPRHDHAEYTWGRVQITELLVMQFSPPCHHFIPVWSKYTPKHTINLCSSVNVRDQVLHPYSTTRKIVV
jgi:hypothetical protein